MVKNINVFDLVRTSDFVREPVDEICDTIESVSAKKIILKGGRGVGKSLVLANSEIRGIGHEKQCIYTHFDAVGLGLELSQNIDESLFIHYYELLLSRKMLNYIKEYYGFTYQTKFMDYHDIIKKYLDEFNNYVNNFVYDDTLKISRFLKQGELSGEIRARMDFYLHICRLNLAIDRFDWTNNNSKLSQEILSGYFDILDKYEHDGMFEKIFITTDDESLNDKSKMRELNKRGYVCSTVEYGKNIDIVREIIRKGVESYNQNVGSKDNQFPFSDITNEILRGLINKTQGNISMMLECLNEVNESLQWDRKGFDMEEEFSSAINERLEYQKQLAKMMQPPKLYL